MSNRKMPATPAEGAQAAQQALAMRSSTNHTVGQQWQAELLMGGPKGTTILGNLANIDIALRRAPEWQGAFSYDVFADKPLILWPGEKEPVELTETHVSKITIWLQHYRVNVGSTTVLEGILTVCHSHEFHGPKAYINPLKWDGVKRLDTILIDHLGAEDTPFNRAVGAKTMIGAVARIMMPGCKMRTVLVLEVIS